MVLFSLLGCYFFECYEMGEVEKTFGMLNMQSTQCFWYSAPTMTKWKCIDFNSLSVQPL